MKKLLLLSIAVLAMASCGNNNKPQTNADSTNIATTDSSLTDDIDTGMGDFIQSAIKLLSSKINAKDSGQFQVALANIQQKIAELTPIRDKIAISCMLREIHEFSSHAIRHGLYIKNRKRLFCL